MGLETCGAEPCGQSKQGRPGGLAKSFLAESSRRIKLKTAVNYHKEQHYGEELRESDEQKAWRIKHQMMREVGWSDANLQQLAKGDEQKMRIAARLRVETTMTWNWIAQQLSMGHWRTAANAVRQFRASGGQRQSPG